MAPTWQSAGSTGSAGVHRSTRPAGLALGGGLPGNRGKVRKPTARTVNSPGQRSCNFEPLLVQGRGAVGCRLPGPLIPIAGVSVIALLAMKPCVDPGTGRIGKILALVMGLIPLAGAGQPQDAEFRGKSGGRSGIGGGGAGEAFGVHAEETSGKAVGLRLSSSLS